MNTEAEKKRIDIFIEALREKLHQKVDEGYTGWDSSNRDATRGACKANNYHAPASTSSLMDRLRAAVLGGKYINVAALAGMLWWRIEKEAKEANKALEVAEE